MRSATRKLIAGIGLIAAFMLMLDRAYAGPLWVGKDTDQLHKVAQEVSPLGADPLGEQIGLYTGSLAFAETDVSVPGNNGLEVGFRRKFSVRDRHNLATTGLLGDWEVDLPRIHGTFAWTAGIASSGWTVATPGAPLNRCSVNTSTPANGQANSAVGSGGYTFASYEYWHGTFLEVPGQVSARLMVIDPANANRPSQGGPYHWVAPDNWVISCLSATANGVPGEAFLAHSPDGTRYWFNWSAKRPAPAIQKMATYNAGGAVYTSLSREEIWMLPTRIEDRFGNYVTYTYDAANPARPINIVSSDGRSIAIAYNAAGRISSVVSHGRTWTYTYNTAGNLVEVLLPDQSSWQMDLAQLSQASFETTGASSCADPGAFAQFNYQGSITHPSGLKGDFVVKRARHGRSYVPKFCIYSVGGGGYPMESNLIDALSITTKTFTGPGIPSQTWAFTYGPSNQSYTENCSGAACATSKWVEVQNPAGEKTRHTFSNRYGSYEGNILQEDVFDSSGGLKRTATTTYVLDPVGQSYPSKVGTTPCTRCDKTGELVHPISQVGVTQDGVGFSRNNQTFDQFAKATTVGKVSSLGSRTDSIVYYHDPMKWVIGQIQTSTNVDTGLVEYRATFDAATAQVTEQRSFEKLKQTLGYNSDGTIATVKDGNNNVTSLTNWKRGIPQGIQYADSTSKSAVVNDWGSLMSTTDENGFTTNYGYDPMGRLASVTYPTGDSTAWNTTTLSFQKIAATEYGIPAGHWRQTVVTGTGQKSIYFDALWRPLVTRDLDATDGTTESLTKRFQRFTYDHDGRVTFASYPGATDALTTGTWTTYDALGRVTASSQDSELSPGILTTTTEYLAGFKTRVTNPRGHQSLTIYQAFDQPSFDAPAGIDHPEGASTEIHRDVFGKVTALRRRNADASLQVWRYYGYNDYQELCRSEEPETGTTLMGYDTAGNLKWSSSGLPAGQACEANGTTTAVAARRSDRTYDSRNRLQDLSFPTGSGSQTWQYWPDGLPRKITTHNDALNAGVVENDYVYNKRRLLTGESSTQLGWYTWSIGYGYDSNGSLSTQTYPTGLVISYAPNALGQATQAGSYASGVQYYPNGAIKQFTYGNGIVHSMAQNARQLPQRVLSPGVADLRYDYDQNANVTVIGDETPGRNTGVHSRWMTYDGLDRLTSAGSCMFGGDCWHRFTYNALDNLTSWKLAGVKDYAEYVYVQNRLANIKNSAGASIVGFEYDPQGNLATKNGQTYQFDYGNRLRSVVNKENYRYDGHGRRVLAWDVASTQSILSMYSNAGQVMYQEDYKNGKNQENIYLAGSIIAIRESPHAGGVFAKFQHTDALGSPVAVTNQAGTVIERNDYEPYGAIIGKPTYQGIGYTGHVQDGATGLTYMQQRYYDPQVGHFLSVDPVTAYSAPVGLFNRYRYANGNPYKFSDPDGRAPECSDRCVAETVVGGQPTLVLAVKIGLALAQLVAGSDSQNNEAADQEQAGGEGPGGAFPDRPLPRSPSGEPIPDPEAAGAPHTQLGSKEGRNGRYPQAREFDADGKPVRDIDFTDHGRPDVHPNPHEHPYQDNPTGGTRQRGPSRPLPRNDIPGGEPEPIPGFDY